MIGEKTGKAAATAASEAVAPVVREESGEELVAEEPGEVAAAVEEVVEQVTKGSKLWLVPVIVGLVLVALLYWYWKRR